MIGMDGWVPQMVSPILIVEDSDEDFTAMQRFLRKAGCTIPVHRCSCGDEALDYLYQRGPRGEDQRRPGLIILDLNLPGTDGRTVLSQIKQDPGLKAIPVLILSSSVHPNDVCVSYRSGANTYLAKPSDPEQFAKMVAAINSYWFDHGAILANFEPGR